MYKIIGADQKEYGPITADQVRFWITEGRANANTRACAEGTSEWKPLGAFPEFAEVFGLGSGSSFGQSANVAGHEPALQALKGPAIGLKVTAGVGLVMVVLGLIVNVLSLTGVQFNFGMQQFGDPSFQKMFSQVGGGLGIVQNLIGAAIGVVIWMGASKMQRLENYQFAMTASVLAMLPCLSPCCLLGLPFGIWALIVLNKAEVKSQFS